MSEHKWSLDRLSISERTALKRAAGSSALNVEAQCAFYKACGYCNEWEEPYQYAAMCMQCLWKSTDTPIKLPMEECLRILLRMQYDDATKYTEHRIMSILETSWGEDDYLLGKILGITRIIKQKMYSMPDFEKLADDLKNWNHPDRFVQKRWIKTIYSRVNEEQLHAYEEETNNAD